MEVWATALAHGWQDGHFAVSHVTQDTPLQIGMASWHATSEAGLLVRRRAWLMGVPSRAALSLLLMEVWATAMGLWQVGLLAISPVTQDTLLPVQLLAPLGT